MLGKFLFSPIQTIKLNFASTFRSARVDIFIQNILPAFIIKLLITSHLSLANFALRHGIVIKKSIDMKRLTTWQNDYKVGLRLWVLLVHFRGRLSNSHIFYLPGDFALIKLITMKMNDSSFEFICNSKKLYKFRFHYLILSFSTYQ